MKKLVLILSLIATMACSGVAQVLKTQGNAFLLGDEPIEMWGIRAASATQHDTLTEALIGNLDAYKRHRVNAVSIFLQGSSGGFSDPFSSDGKALDKDHQRRLYSIVEACADRSMVVIVGIFYQRVVANLKGNRKVSTPEAIKSATRTVAELLKPYRNVIINIANEQNSFHYRKFAAFSFNDPHNIIDLCKIVKEQDTERIVGAGGYHDSLNVIIGRSDWVDVLLFDTDGKDVEKGHHSGWHYDYFRAQGVPDKPIINVEIFGGWTKQFTPPGNYSEVGKEIHLREIIEAKKRPGLWVHLHSNTWCQGSADGFPIRYDLGGQGTKEDPGIRWWFEAIKR
ncbi:MAG: hypothetical protein HKN87_04125 [Saprospiraceae bacterium]|nr:hypothetical protein [Saprospiraceae bacterium]